ncbi:MAG: TlpA family protein disulfide reductase [Paracoccus denitrificans]|nr:MAG: TlpA family protein disulfide reductase [Paracoccus denitrificans]PZO85135.1 MAG: TlpA family protein disulfide reductase [Paracoccus denitrificans]
MLRRLFLYTALICAANAGVAVAGPVDWDAARQAGLSKLVDAAPKPVPQTEFTDPDGKPVTLADYKGKALLINFWATWCAPCREEMPSLDRLQTQLGGDDFQVLTIASGRNPPASINKFFTEESITALPRLTDTKMALARQMGVLAMPVSILVDHDGNEVARMVGDADWSSPAAVAMIEQLKAKP